MKRIRLDDNNDSVFNNDYFVQNILMQYLDEIDLYQLSRVNRVCSRILMWYTKRNTKLSLLSHWFERHKICIECFGKLKKYYSNELGLYCHKHCIPALLPYYASDDDVIAIPVEPIPVSGRAVRYLYNTHNPAVNDLPITVMGHHRHYAIKSYRSIDLLKVENNLNIILNVVNSIRDKERLKLYGERREKIKMGDVYFSLYSFYNKVETNHMNRYSVEENIKNMRRIGDILIDINNRTTEYFKTKIQPKLFIKQSNWLSALKTVDGDLSDDMLIGFIIEKKCIPHPDHICKMLDMSIEAINYECMHKCMYKNLFKYYVKAKDVNNVLSDNRYNVRKDMILDFVNKFLETDEYSEITEKSEVSKVNIEAFIKLKNHFNKILEIMVTIGTSRSFAGNVMDRFHTKDAWDVYVRQLGTYNIPDDFYINRARRL